MSICLLRRSNTLCYRQRGPVVLQWKPILEHAERGCKVSCAIPSPHLEGGHCRVDVGEFVRRYGRRHLHLPKGRLGGKYACAWNGNMTAPGQALAIGLPAQALIGVVTARLDRACAIRVLAKRS